MLVAIWALRMKLDVPFPIYGDVTFRGRCPREDVEQVTFFNRLRAEHTATLGLLAIHPRNEGLRQRGQIGAVAKHRAEGMSKGAADIIIPGRPAFVCELKRRDHTQSEWQDGQMDYLTAAYMSGAFTCVALGADAAWQALRDWQGCLDG